MFGRRYVLTGLAPETLRRWAIAAGCGPQFDIPNSAFYIEVRPTAPEFRGTRARRPKWCSKYTDIAIELSDGRRFSGLEFDSGYDMRYIRVFRLQPETPREEGK